MTKTIRTPKRFYDDCHECDCFVPTIVRETKAHYFLDAESNLEGWEDISSRADYYSDSAGFDPDTKKVLVPAARAFLRAANPKDVIEVIKLREAAAASYKKKENSWNRSDTDGFLSQWASGISASLKLTKANLIEDGRIDTFVGLYEGDRRVKARKISTQYGTSWLVHDDEAELRDRRGKPFFPTGSNSRVLKQYGLVERRENAPAWARLSDNGEKGLSGCASTHVEIFRTGDKWGADADLI